MNNQSFFKWMLSISLCLMLFSCSDTKGDTLPNPAIKDGRAKLSGKITNFHPYGENARMLTLSVPHPVTAETYKITTEVSEDGSFAFEVLMQCNYTIAYIIPRFDSYDMFGACLISGKETKMDIVYGETTGAIKSINQSDSIGLTSTDLININKLLNKLISYSSPGLLTSYAKTPNEYVQRVRISLNNRLKRIAENKILPENAKNFLTNEMKLLNLNFNLFRYREGMRNGYLNAGNKDVENFNPPEPDKKYYAFLKDFDLNNPQYLYNGYYYCEVLQTILSNDTLNIPPIRDISVDQWMKEVKSILSKLVGFDKGLFYDMLASNSYARQFDNELKPLSDKQIENIKNYFTGEKEDFAKILLRKNEEIIRLAAQKETLVVNETPAVAKEKLMDAIVSKYHGKVVVVDFWATWCAPCLDAIQKYRTVKGKLKGKNVVFVYLTNRSSPQKLWKEKITGIGGEHYYLNDDKEWMQLMDTFGFEAIPSYVIFDAQGKISHKFTGFPGNEKMQEMIEKLLP